MRDDRSVVDLLRADYVRQRTAGQTLRDPERLWQPIPARPVPDEAGTTWTRQHLTDIAARLRTSPVVRGKWIWKIFSVRRRLRRRLTCLSKENEKGQKPKTMREQMAEHRANPTCASCHKIMDPIGLRWRTSTPSEAWRTEDAGTRSTHR